MKKEFLLEKTHETSVSIEIIKEDEKYIAKVKRNFNDFWTENDEYECWIEDDGELMTEPVSTEKEWDAIIETFCSYIEGNGTKYARQCTCCGKGMNEGYFAEYEYFCSDSCLHTEFAPTIWESVAQEDSDTHYWTEWECEEDYQYVLFNNQLIEL
jgi:hypothetical protein